MPTQGIKTFKMHLCNHGIQGLRQISIYYCKKFLAHFWVMIWCTTSLKRAASHQLINLLILQLINYCFSFPFIDNKMLFVWFASFHSFLSNLIHQKTLTFKCTVLSFECIEKCECSVFSVFCEFALLRPPALFDDFQFLWKPVHFILFVPM